MRKPITICIALLACISLQAQIPANWQPSHAEILQRYKRASILDSLTKNSVFKTSVDAHWAPDGSSFWYCNILKDSVREYFQVDAATGKKTKLDAAPAAIEPPSVDRFRRRRNEFRGGNISPDKKWEAYIDNGNLFVKPADATKTGSPIQFTTDGTNEDPYGSIAWSPDSKYLAGYHIHPVKDSTVSFILTSLPNTTRGQVRTRPYRQPGDPFTSYELYVFLLDQHRTQKIITDIIDFPDFAPELHWHFDNPNLFTYEKADRGHQRFRIIEVDAAKATTRNIVDEKTNTFIYLSRVFTYYPKGTNYLIRSSEKDGWRHLYLVDLATAKETPITKGDWVVRNIDSVDIAKKQVWFSAGGINPEEDPYFIHYYRINFDGTHLLPLTPETGNHQLTWSPNHQYYIDTYSRINVAPITKLKRNEAATTKEIAILEQADLTYYKTIGIHPTEPFVAKGRDGKTDIYGIVSFPADFDPNKKYPVLENIYAGPHDAFVPKSFVPYSEMQSLAQLGFIVVMIDGMGTANRSKAFHDVCWQNIADAGLPDRIAWIKALAKKYPNVDTTRVGIYGTSAGGQNSTGALLFHPEFYKAAVSACGCHDNRVDKQWWNEQWMGYPVGKHYEEQSNVTNAYKLQGHLLLIVGEADTNVPPESTYRVCDALIHAGKSFDFLSLPGMDHSDGGYYGRMKKRNFFVKYLLGVEPPDPNAGEMTLIKDLGRERWSFQ